MGLDLITFILYLFIAGNTTVFVGRTLYSNGEVFLEIIFASLPKLVKPLNNILLIGFYLINLGFVLAFFSWKPPNLSWMECFEFLVNSLGIVYLVYLIVTLTMTAFVAKLLFQNSKVFMLDIFRGRAEIANPTNRLFEIGFYLMNIGAALLFMKTTTILTNQGLLETLSYKIGAFSIYLGVMLFMNLFLFFRAKESVVKKHCCTTQEMKLGLD